jgi:hypothetical protein
MGHDPKISRRGELIRSVPLSVAPPNKNKNKNKNNEPNAACRTAYIMQRGGSAFFLRFSPKFTTPFQSLIPPSLLNFLHTNWKLHHL